MMATTAARTFTIFVDEAPSRPRVKKASRNNGVVAQGKPPIASSVSSNINIPPPVPSFATASEKENLHPITSARLGLEGISKGKGKDGKGKSALATKLFLPKAERIEKDKPEMKKRRLASTSTSSTLPNTSTIKSSKFTAASVRVKSGIPRRKDPRAGLTTKVAEMPKVEEEAEVMEVKEKETVKETKMIKETEKAKAKRTVDEKETKALSAQTQAEIDAKCYDLTVSPLADVSKAYEQVIASDIPVSKKPPPQVFLLHLLRYSSLTFLPRIDSHHFRR